MQNINIQKHRKRRDDGVNINDTVEIKNDRTGMYYEMVKIIISFISTILRISETKTRVKMLYS